MSAAVESMAFLNDLVKFDSGVPWHGSGIPVTSEDEAYNIDVFMKKAGLDWRVYKDPLITYTKAQAAINYSFKLDKNSDQCPQISPNTGAYAVVRETDKSVLGVVGEQWTPLQNIESFEFFKPWLDNKICAINTAGSLFDGKKVWVLCQVMENTLSEVVKGDNVGRFLLLSNSHDGSSSVRASFVSVRVVCANTIRLAENTASSYLRIRHSSKVKENLDAVREIVNLSEREFQASVKQYQFLASRKINKDDLRKYVRILVQDKKLAETQKWVDVPTRTQNIIKDIEAFMDHPNQRLSAGSWWAAYNSVNSYANHKKGRTESARLNNVWFNDSEDKKAFELALEMAA